MDMKDLAAVTEQWMQLERKTLKQRQEAEKFYEEHLMGLIEEDFMKRNQPKVFERAEYLIISIGTSFEPLVLGIKLLMPQKILFLCTEKTEKYIEKIVRYCNLPVFTFRRAMVSETDPSAIYMEIKNAFVAWGKPSKLYIDFTGGTKAMSAAAAMAGALINVQLVYIGTSEYLPDFRKPMPGSETFYYIPNPIEIFGDLEIEKAFALFDRHNYVGARKKLGDIKENIPDPDIRQQLNFAYLLAAAYEHWDALEFKPAYEKICQLNKEIARDKFLHQSFLLVDMERHFLAQERILAPLCEIPELIRERRSFQILTDNRRIVPLMFTMCQSALVREKQEKYDMATLLLYRLLEMIEQRRLAHYNLYVSHMEYRELKLDADKHPEWAQMEWEEYFTLLKARYNKIKELLFRKKVNPYLPDQISLLEGFILLAALDDDIGGGDQKAIDKLKRIRAMVYLRNNSIFAHGLGPVGKEDFQKFKKFVMELLEEFCNLEEMNYHQYLEDMQWLSPFHSRNYARMEE